VANLEMTGTVLCLQTSEFSGFTQIQDAAGERELFILWFNPGAQIPQVLTPFTPVVLSMWTSLLREAHTNGSTVTLIHGEDSAEVFEVRLGQF
jgi:hypothetical protein